MSSFYTNLARVDVSLTLTSMQPGYPLVSLRSDGHRAALRGHEHGETEQLQPGHAEGHLDGRIQQQRDQQRRRQEFPNCCPVT